MIERLRQCLLLRKEQVQARWAASTGWVQMACDIARDFWGDIDPGDS